jgi:AraC-like DNA-binding protein
VVAELHGVHTRLGLRRLAGSGWTVAALLAPGGLGALLPGRAARMTDRVLAPADALGAALGADPAAAQARLVARIDGVHGDDPDAVERRRVELLRTLLERLVAAADPARVAAARQVAAVARLAETDRGIDRLDQLAEAAGVTPRTLQRLFTEHAGVPVTWVLRRYRIIEAAERARTGGGRPWAELAADLGYSDQAHLIRDFRAHLGTTPAAYAARQEAARG